LHNQEFAQKGFYCRLAAILADLRCVYAIFMAPSINCALDYLSMLRYTS